MIASLSGKVIEFFENSLVVDVQGVGYEVTVSPQVCESFRKVGAQCRLFIHAHYKTDGVSLYGIGSSLEKQLFLQLIKVDSVGPKSALNILSAAPLADLVQFIEEGDVATLSKLPKISKKTAEHLVVKLKGKLGSLNLNVVSGARPVSQARQNRSEALIALSHLGYKAQDVERALSAFDDDVWKLDLESIIRRALNQLSGHA
jgi:Holliday junction DNA helicase RuvA